MKRFIAFLLIAGLAGAGFAAKSGGRIRALKKTATLDQEITFDANRMSGLMRNNGIWFLDVQASDWGLEWPRGSGNSPIYAGGQWISAKVNGEVKLAAVIHDGTEFQPGVISGGAAANPRDPAYKWYVIRPGGQGDWDSWPKDQGAPVDEEGNPKLIGDRTAFCVWNDMGEHLEFATNQLGVEVQQTVFAFDRADALGDMVFIKWRMVNKSESDWDSTYFSIWLDPDVGYGYDDLVGCDPDLGLGFCYNGTNEDQDYGSAPPATGIDFFQGPIIDQPGSTVTLPDGTALPDKTMIKMTAFIFYDNNDSNTGNPNTSQDVWNYQRGYWRDNSRITNPDGVFTPFMFTGDPEAATGWLDADESDRRFLMTTGPFTMQKWEDVNSNGLPDFGEPGVQEIVACVMATRGASNLNSVTQLKEIDVLAQMAYDLNFNLAKAPFSPDVDVHELANEILLSWDDRSEFNEDGSPYESEDPIVANALGDTVILNNIVRVIDDATYNFYGYTVYQYSDASGSDPVVIGHWDNTGTADAEPYTQHRYIRILQNVNPVVGNVGERLVNGKDYFFGVVAHAYLEYGAPVVFDSPPAIVTVVPQSKPGIQYASSNNDTLEVTHQITEGLASDGSVIAVVVDPSRVTGDYYRVVFSDAGTWSVIRCADSAFTAGVDTVLKDQTNQAGDDAYTIVDGLLIKVFGPVNDLRNIQVVSNANGLLDPPDMGCFAFNSNGFPMLLDYDYQPVLDENGDQVDCPGATQQSNGSTWGIHIGMNSAEMDPGYDFFKSRLTNDGARWPLIIPDDFEIRFTAAGGKAYIPNAFGYDGGDFGGVLVDVPFELWNIGILEDPADDVRLFPYLLDDDSNERFALLTQASVTAAGDTSYGYPDHTVSGGANDPFTDWFYWVIPENTAPGQAGYDALVAKIQTEGDNYEYLAGTLGDCMRRMVLVNWNGGETETGEYNAQMPETGTVFRILTAKPNMPKDIYSFKTPANTRDLADRKADLKKINVVPNPYYGYHSGEMDAFERWVQFTFLPDKCTIRIFDLAGNLIRKLEKDTPDSPLLRWDLKNEYQLPVASGIYVYHVSAPDLGEKIGKMAVFTPNERLDTY
ncbi:hypothetical protein JW906_07735 [bacterium]|nr:hypothetical protein [bacterium]